MNLNSLTHCVLAVARELDLAKPRTPSREAALMDPNGSEEFSALMMEKCQAGLAHSLDLQGKQGMEQTAADDTAIEWLTAELRRDWA